MYSLIHSPLIATIYSRCSENLLIYNILSLSMPSLLGIFQQNLQATLESRLREAHIQLAMRKCRLFQKETDCCKRLTLGLVDCKSKVS